MINLKFFNQDKNIECDEKEKYYIDNYIKKFNNNAYLLNYNKKEYDFYTLYYLSSISQNVINWYNFEPKSKVLQIEIDLGNITEALAKKDIDLTVVTNSLEKAEAIQKRCSSIKELEIICSVLHNVKFEKKFDYIVLIGNLPYRNKIFGNDISVKDYLIYLKELLSDKGKILLAIDNRFAIRTFCGGNDFYTENKYDSITGYDNYKDKGYSFSKTQIDGILRDIGMSTINHYYPLPDFRLPNVIFSDNCLPNYTNFSKYEPYTLSNDQVLISEIELFRELLRENKDLFTVFANSFFIETGMKKSDIKYKFISYNNMRKAKYRLITKIRDEYVEKDVTNIYSEQHYNYIKNNIKLLKDEKYDLLDSDKNGLIISKYIVPDNMLSNILAKFIEKEDYDNFYKTIDSYFDIFYQRSKKIKAEEKTVFEKYNISIEKKEDLNYLENGFWDATFSNCFLLNDKFYIFDQEWREENLPVEYIIYKSIFYDNFITRHIKLETVAKRYNFLQYIDSFKKLDSLLQEKIRDEKIWRFYASINLVDWKSYINAFEGVKNENENLKVELSEARNIINETNNIIKEMKETFAFKLQDKIERFFRRK